MREPFTPRRSVHAAGIVDASTARFFVDGKLQRSVVLTANYRRGSESFMIGATPPLDSGLMKHPFSGTIDELRLSKVARYSADFTPPTRFEPDKDTLALYHFDEGQGDILTDSSGNHHHGKIVNAKWVLGIAAGPMSK
jgi:hypothetical protein